MVPGGLGRHWVGAEGGGGALAAGAGGWGTVGVAEGGGGAIQAGPRGRGVVGRSWGGAPARYRSVLPLVSRSSGSVAPCTSPGKGTSRSPGVS